VIRAIRTIRVIRAARTNRMAFRRLGALIGISICAFVAVPCGCAGQRAGEAIESSPSTQESAPSAPPTASMHPAPALLTAEELLGQIDARGLAVERFDADLEMSLRRADGAQVTLAGSLSMARPDRCRLRSTKFGFLVCDVVLCDGEGWALVSPVVREQAEAAAGATHELMKVLGSLLGWRDGAMGAFAIVEEGSDRLVARGEWPQGMTLEWTLSRDDGRVLEVRRLETGQIVGTLRCSDHVHIDRAIVPTRLLFESATGRIDVRVRSPRVNEQQSEHAFSAPKGAQRLE